MSFSQVTEAQFQQLLEGASGAEKSFREEAWREYQKIGLPNRKNEAWKYTSLSSLTKKSWNPAPAKAPLPPEVLKLRDGYHKKFDVAVVMNGEWRPEESLIKTPELRFEHASLEDLEAGKSKDGFAILAGALAKPGLSLEIADNCEMNRPLMILYSQSEGEFISSSFHRLRLGMGSRLHIAECFVGGQASWRWHQMRVELGENSELMWLRLQREAILSNHWLATKVQVPRSARVHFTQLNSGGSWVRSHFDFDLKGEGASVQVQGLNFGRATQHVDQRLSLNHMSARTESSQLFKGVLKDSARGVLNGRIYIAPDAQKVISSQLNHNLLLSSKAEADTKPELEIYADDVKANHGASIGRMDESKVFYLMSRGLTENQARQMLARAFVADVLMKIPRHDLRDLAEEHVENILPEFVNAMETAT